MVTRTAVKCACTLISYDSYNKLHVFTQCKFISSEFERSDFWNGPFWSKIKMLTGLHSFLEALGENEFSHLVQRLHRLACGRFLRLPQWAPCKHHASTWKNSCDCTGAITNPGSSCHSQQLAPIIHFTKSYHTTPQHLTPSHNTPYPATPHHSQPHTDGFSMLTHKLLRLSYPD